MKKIILILFLAFSTVCRSQDPHKSFENLKKVKLNNAKIEFWYLSESTTIYDVAIKDMKDDLIKNSGELKEDEYLFAHGYLVAKTKINSKEECIIIYVACWDGGFRFYHSNTNKQFGELLSHGQLVVPGNGAIYAKDHIYNFMEANKYEFVRDTITKVKQPYLYVGLKSKTLKEIKIYDSKEKKKLIATLPPNYEIEVLFAENEQNYQSWKHFYLVRTSFGLCGWAELEGRQSESVDVEGLFYNSD